MAISKENKEFIESLIDYYISESESYKQIAENFIPEVESIPDTAFGIITGCVYSGFLQAYQNQQQSPGLEDVREFNQIMKEHALPIKKAILEPAKQANQDDKESDDKESDDKESDDKESDDKESDDKIKKPEYKEGEE